ncbi:macro domain-containing protein [Streptomyces abyssomicinicus]|uniref:macro domain-containing protein n=1 Tax=Streptomyces abyssomicinicus TaxID=574929 RepID=UPI001FE3D869|nr:macro domain-containing protein [Streptomyces abyssomicinicus]
MSMLPSREELTGELRELRQRGFPRLRLCPRDALRAAGTAAGFCTGPDDELDGIEDLLRAAVRRLGGGGEPRDAHDYDPLARAAAHAFGLFAFHRGAAAADRRKAAAAVYGVTTERFRKSQEREVIEGVAAAVLALARSGAPAGPEAGPATPAPTIPSPRAPVSFPVPLQGAAPAPRPPVGRVTVRLGAIEKVGDVDILVSSENVYLEMSKTFRPTVSGALRRAATQRDGAGEAVDDVLTRELTVWLRTHHRTGRAVPPGTVVPTSPGALVRQGVRRVYHAAVATPVNDGEGYHVSPSDIAAAVRACFQLAREERTTLALPLTGICFPLLGAGHGGLPAGDAARHLVRAVRAELRQDPSWSVLLVNNSEVRADLLRRANSEP